MSETTKDGEGKEGSVTGGKEQKGSCDLVKSKIEVVRDALKDASDTIRAQDRKASYMIAIIFFLVTSFIYATLRIKKGFVIYNYQLDYLNNLPNLFVFFPIIYFFIAIVILLYSYTPISNPTDALTKEDVDFGKDKFFTFHMKDKEKSAETLAKNFIAATEDMEGVLRILYVEILKVSKIREIKISLIKHASRFLLVGILFEFIQIISFYMYSPCLFGLSIIVCILVYFILWLTPKIKKLIDKNK